MSVIDENVKKSKDALRLEYRSRRASIPADEKRALDERICAAIISLASFRYAHTVLMYAPTGSEIDLMPIALHALKCGKRVAFPRCNVADRTMDFKYVDSLDELSVGEYSIREPDESAPSVIDFSHSICIVPGLVFDREGFRVGYGKGYYDRFLSNYGETKIGPVYSDFILDYVPRGRFDRRVDTLVCEKGVIIAESPKSK